MAEATPSYPDSLANSNAPTAEFLVVAQRRGTVTPPGESVPVIRRGQPVDPNTSDTTASHFVGGSDTGQLELTSGIATPHVEALTAVAKPHSSVREKLRNLSSSLNGSSLHAKASTALAARRWKREEKQGDADTAAPQQRRMKVAKLAGSAVALSSLVISGARFVPGVGDVVDNVLDFVGVDGTFGMNNEGGSRNTVAIAPDTAPSDKPDTAPDTAHPSKPSPGASQSQTVPTEHSFKADHGESVWSRSERILKEKAEAGGVDIDKLRNADTIKVMDGILDDTDNRGKFYGDNDDLLNKGTRYDDEQAMQIADDIIDKYDGNSPVLKTPAPAQHTSAIDVDKITDKVTDAAHKSYEETKAKLASPAPSGIPAPTPSEESGQNIFERGWNHTTDWISDTNESFEVWNNKHALPVILGAIAVTSATSIGLSTYIVGSRIKETRANRTEVLDVKHLSDHPLTQAEADYARTSAAAFHEIVARYGRQPDDSEEDDGSDDVEPGVYNADEYAKLVEEAKQKVKSRSQVVTT